MFGKIKGWIEAHPYEAAGAVFVAVLLLLYFFSGSKTASAATGDTSGEQLTAAQIAAESSVDQAQVQAASQLAIAQAGAQSQTNLANVQLSAVQTNDATEVQLATLNDNASLSALQSNNSTALSVAQIQANLDQTVNQNATNEAEGENYANYQVALTQIGSNETVNLANISAAEQTETTLGNDFASVENAQVAAQNNATNQAYFALVSQDRGPLS